MLINLCTHYVYGQTATHSFNKVLIRPTESDFIKTDSGLLIRQRNRNACKGYRWQTSFIANYVEVPIVSDAIIAQMARVPKLITVHGNISYDFFYRSKVDTPFNQKNFQQHTEKVYLDILLKEKYPLKVAFTLRQSNSPYFKNFGDINVHFDPYAYRKSLKQELINKITDALSKTQNIKAIEALIKDKEKQLAQLKNWLESPATLQKIIEQREIIDRKKTQLNLPSQGYMMPSPENNPSSQFKPDQGLGQPASFVAKKDSIAGSFEQFFSAKEKELDSLKASIKSLSQKEDSLKNDIQKEIITAKQKIYKAGNEKEMMKIASENGVNGGNQDKPGTGLAAIRNFSIGRSIVNYTELTAQDITVTGINVEYNPSYYAAFAAGKIDYRFRDFYNKNIKNNGQYLVLGRIGAGNPDKRALILTVFKGQKNAAEYVLNDSASNHVGIVGYSLESILRKDENTSISFEVAKSTKPSTGNLQVNKEIGQLWKFSDQSNLGINIKGQTIIAETHTKLSGFFRKTGENFQSFSLFTYNTNQTAWLGRADQYFYQDKLGVTAMLRRNDFTNPFTLKTYKASTVFKSLLVNVRVPKYPSLSVGYYPGTQLFIVDKETIKENAYYLLNGSLAYSYSYKKINMNSLLVYNRYFNKATDSGFVLYKGTSYYGMQTFFLRKLQLQAGFAYNSQEGLKYSTTEASGDYAIKQPLKIGIGIKYNKILGGETYLGKRMQLMMDIKKLGRLQFQYEKSYMPTISHSLFPVEIGRVSWYKYF